MSKQKRHKLLIQKTDSEYPTGSIRKFFFAVYDAAKGYPEGFVCNLPVDPAHWQSSREPVAALLFPKNLEEFAVELLVEAYAD